MKTKELIRQLQAADPTGELHVSIGNVDIHFVETLPGYYDGCQQILIRDEENQYYNIVGAKYNSAFPKVQIHTLSITTALWNDTKLQIDYSDLGEERQKRYAETHEQTRKEVEEFEFKSELEYFTEHITKRAAEFTSELEESNLKDACKEFFVKNLSHDDPMPEDIIALRESYVGRRNVQWAREIELTYDGEFILTLRR